MHHLKKENGLESAYRDTAQTKTFWMHKYSRRVFKLNALLEYKAKIQTTLQSTIIV